MLILIKLEQRKKIKTGNVSLLLLKDRKWCHYWDMERYNMETKFDKHSVPVAIDNIPKKERKTNKQQRQKKNAHTKPTTTTLCLLCIKGINSYPAIKGLFLWYLIYFSLKISHRGKLCNSRMCSEHINHRNLSNKQRLHHHNLWPWICKESTSCFFQDSVVRCCRVAERLWAPR